MVFEAKTYTDFNVYLQHVGESLLVYKDTQTSNNSEVKKEEKKSKKFEPLS